MKSTSVNGLVQAKDGLIDRDVIALKEALSWDMPVDYMDEPDFRMLGNAAYFYFLKSGFMREGFSANFEKKYGSMDEIKSSLRPNASEFLLGIIEDRGLLLEPTPPSDVTDYAALNSYLEALKVAMEKEYGLRSRESLTENEIIDELVKKYVLYQQYFSAHINDVNRVATLLWMPSFLNTKQLDTVTNNMEEEDWNGLKYSLKTRFIAQGVGEEESTAVAEVIEDIMRRNGDKVEEFFIKNGVGNCSKLMDHILQCAVYFNRISAVASYIKKRLELHALKKNDLKVEDSSLFFAIINCSMEMCDILLSKEACVAYSDDATAIILTAILEDGQQRQKLLLKYIENKNLLVNSEVIDLFKKASRSDQETLKQQVRYLQKIYQGDTLEPCDLSGLIFIAPKDGTISTEELSLKSVMYGDYSKNIKALGEIVREEKYKSLGWELIYKHQPVITANVVYPNNYQYRMKGVNLFNSIYIANLEIAKRLDDYTVGEIVYSDYLNSRSAETIDPVAKLLSASMVEYLEYDTIFHPTYGLKKVVSSKDNIGFFRHAAHELYKSTIPEKGGVLVEDIIFGDGEKAIKIIKEFNKSNSKKDELVFAEPEMAALHFAVVFERANVVKYCLESYLDKIKIRPDHNNSAGVKIHALQAIIRGEKDICLLFLKKDIWEQYAESLKLLMISLIATRSGRITRDILMESLLYDGLLTAELRRGVSNLVHVDREEVIALYEKYHAKSLEWEKNVKACEKSKTTIENLLSGKAENIVLGKVAFKLKDQIYKLDNKRNTAIDDAIRMFVNDNLQKLRPYKDVKEEDLIKLFGDADFIPFAGKLIGAIKVECILEELIGQDEKSDKGKKYKKTKESFPMPPTETAKAGNAAEVTSSKKANVMVAPSVGGMIKADNAVVSTSAAIMDEGGDFTAVKGRKDRVSKAVSNNNAVKASNGGVSQYQMPQQAVKNNNAKNGDAKVAANNNIGKSSGSGDKSGVIAAPTSNSKMPIKRVVQADLSSEVKSAQQSNINKLTTSGDKKISDSVVELSGNEPAQAIKMPGGDNAVPAILFGSFAENDAESSAKNAAPMEQKQVDEVVEGQDKDVDAANSAIVQTANDGANTAPVAPIVNQVIAPPAIVSWVRNGVTYYGPALSPIPALPIIQTSYVGYAGNQFYYNSGGYLQPVIVYGGMVMPVMPQQNSWQGYVSAQQHQNQPGMPGNFQSP